MEILRKRSFEHRRSEGARQGAKLAMGIGAGVVQSPCHYGSKGQRCTRPKLPPAITDELLFGIATRQSKGLVPLGNCPIRAAPYRSIHLRTHRKNRPGALPEGGRSGPRRRNREDDSGVINKFSPKISPNRSLSPSRAGLFVPTLSGVITKKAQEILGFKTSCPLKTLFLRMGEEGSDKK